MYVGNAILYSNEEHEYVVVHGKEDRSEVLSRENSCVKEYKVDLYRKINLFNDFLCLLQVVKIIKREEPDVIHCHSAKGGVVGRIAGWITRKKTYYTPHAFSFLSANKGYKRKLYLFLERICKLNSYLLACSESEREIINKNSEYIDVALTFEELDSWIEQIWEPFYNDCEESAKLEGGMLLDKFYDEGAFATLAAIWKQEEQTSRDR